MKSILCLTIALGLFNLCLAVRAQVPGSINYQGRLTDQTGIPLVNEPNNAADGRIDLRLQIFDALTGGASQRSRTVNDVEVINGLFSVLLDGLNTDIIPATGQINRWLQVEVSTDNGVTFIPLAPREEIVSAAYAIQAGDAQTLGGILVADRANRIVRAENNVNINMNGNEVRNANRIQVLSDRADGRVLTSDADGFGTWRAPTAGAETDPQVGAMTDGRVPRWNNTANELQNGTIFDDGNGNIGVGTAGPLLERLHVEGGRIVIRNNAAGNRLVWQRTDNTQITGFSSDGFSELQFLANNAERMRITGAGNVGLGTPNPSARLHVNQVGANNRDSGLYIQRAGSDYGAVMYVDSDGRVRIGTRSDPGTAYDTDYIFLNTGSGNVTIGEPYGAQYSTLAIKQRLPGQKGIWLQSYQDGSALNFYHDGNKAVISTDASVSGNAYAPLVLQTTGGNVGVGTPSPSFKLHVNGNAQFNDYVNVLGLLTAWANIHANVMQTTSYYDGYGPFLALRATDGYTVLQPGISGLRVTDYKNKYNNLFLDNADPSPTVHISNLSLPYGYLYEGSDSRLKQEQEPLDYGLAEVLKLQAKRYIRAVSLSEANTMGQESDEEEPESEIGFIAQEVYEVVPEAVATIEDNGKEIWLLSYSSLVPVLAKAIQEQQAQIEELKKEIQALAARSAPLVSGTLPDTSLTADFDGDGRTDRALVSANGDWYFWISGSGLVKIGPYNFGVTGKPVAADYDGDGKADPGMVSASGEWHVWLSGSGYSQGQL